MKLKPFQKQDYARLALVPGGILGHDPGLGKTWAAYSWAFLKAGYTHSELEGQKLLTPKQPVLIVEPGDLHRQFVEEGRSIFKTHVTALDSQATFLKLSRIDPATGKRCLPPGFYITSYTQLGSNGVADFPNPYKTHPKALLEFLGCNLEEVRAAFCGGHLASDSKGYYKLLGVPRCATKEEINRAYRLLCKKYHPDVSNDPNADEIMKRINAAHSLLTDDTERTEYDRTQTAAPQNKVKFKVKLKNAKGEDLVKANRGWDDLTEEEQLEILREFCIAKIQTYSRNVREWGHRLPERDGSRPVIKDRYPARCVLSPSLADLCQDCFAAVIVDEGTRMKGGETTEIATGVLQMNSPHRLVLTATPIKNRVPDVFWLAWWACGGQEEGHARWPYAITDKEEFAATFCVSERNLTRQEKEKRTGGKRRFVKLTPQVCNIHRIWKLMAPIILRRRKKDIGEQIVQKNRHVYRVPMGTRQAQLYKNYLDWTPVDKNGMPAIGVRLQALRMVAAAPNSSLLPLGHGPSYIPKLAAALTLIDQILRRGEQAMIFSPFHDPLDTLSVRLHDAGVRHFVLDGRTSQAQRGKIASVFKQGQAGGIPILLAGIECMAEGHSFHLCNNEILLSYPWALDKVVQAEDRSHRLNSRNDLNVYRLICDGSIDRKMESQIEEKADAAELVLDGHLLGEMGTELNLAELLDIAAKEFDEATKTIDESVLESEWPALRDRLREAFGLWQESQPECANVQTAQPAALPLVVPSPIESPAQSPILLAGITGWRQRWLRRARAAA